ncbi:MAG: prepilin-type N-terminal cleavage/methylation domain-containing protein [Candidatus Saccharibacteria bacterium]|nr:prepilin-type N-terminal cleavage/methylation domain-containing protein [Candidatus Saccharibacteria bacterium]
MRKSISGFTLIELLLAVVITAILATIGVVTYQKVREKAYDAKVDATLEQVQKAFRLYITKGNALPLRHYSPINFYATPGGGWADQGITVFGGGGIGHELANKGYLPRTLTDSLKGGPSKDLSLKNGIKFLTCGRTKVFFAIESYEGISESTLNAKINQLQCGEKNYRDWLQQHGATPGGYGWASGTYRVQPNYKIAEIDIE